MKKIFLLIVICGLSFFSEAQKSGYKVEQSRSTRSKSSSSIREKVFFQPNFGFAFSNNNLYLDVSPNVGYLITDAWAAGFGGSYIYSKTEVSRTTEFVSNTWGGNLFTRYTIYEPVFIMARYEFMTTKWDHDPNRYSYDAFLAGGGIVQPMGRNSYFVLSVLYNLNYDSNGTYQDNGPYGSPYVINMGVQIGF